MPNGEGATKFPVLPRFPTTFSEKEAKRLKELEEEKARVEQIFTQKFVPEAWARVPPWEKAIRMGIPAWGTLRPVAAAVTPWEWGWEYGFTPRQAEEYREKVWEERKKLARKEKVTRLLPIILGDLELAVLSGEPIESVEELVRRAFPEELSRDFLDEEKGFIAAYGQRLLRATPEEILSGKILAEFFEGVTKPLTKEGWAEYFKEAPPIDPRFILSTVAFSKDISAISEALKLAYPPQVKDIKAEDVERLKQERLEYYKQWAIEQGIRPKEGESILKTIEKAQKKSAEEEGELITLVNQETGEPILGKKKQDNTIWVGDELLGYLEGDRVVPIAYDGEPITSETSLINKLKAIGSNLYRMGVEMAHATKQYILAYAPEMIFSSSGISLEEQVKKGWITQEQADELKAKKDLRPWSKAVDKVNEQIVNIFREKHTQRELEHQEWLREEHPEFIPVPEWEKPVLEVSRESPRTLLNPLYWIYLFSESATFTGAFLGASISVGLLTKNPAAGLAAGVVVTTPFETELLIDELISVGVSYEQAVELALPVGALISSVEIMGGLPLLKALLPSMFRGLKREVLGEVSRATVRRLALKGLKTFTTIEFMETLEEVLQESIHNATVRWFDKTKEVFATIPEIVLRTLLATIPLASIGGSSTIYHRVKDYLPPETRKKIDTSKLKLVDAGLTEEHAEAVAFAEALDDEKVQAQVEQAVEKVDKQIIPEVGETIDKARAIKITNQEKKLTTINQDIETFSNSIKLQQDRLTKQTIPFERTETQETISGLQEQLDELQIKKNKLIRQLQGLRKPVEVPEVAPAPEIKRPTLREYVTERDPTWREADHPSEILDRYRAAYEREFPEVEVTEPVAEPFTPPIQEVPESEVNSLQQIYNKTGKLPEQITVIHFTSGLKTFEIIPLRVSNFGEAPYKPGGGIWVSPEQAEFGWEKWAEFEYPTWLEGKKKISFDIDTSNVVVINSLEDAKTKLTWRQDVGYRKRLDVEVLKQKGVTGIYLTYNGLQEVKSSKDVSMDTWDAESIFIMDESIIRNVKVITPEVTIPKAEVVEPIAEPVITEPILAPERPVPLSGETPTGMPRLIDFSEEQDNTARALGNNLVIARRINRFTPPKIKGLRAEAERTLEELHSRYDEATKEERGEIAKEFTQLARSAHLRQKDLLGNHWNDLTPPQKASLTLAMIPDRSIPYRKEMEAADIKHFVRWLEEETGLPFYQLYPRIRQDVGASARQAEEALWLLRIVQVGDTRTNKESLKRITQTINSENPRLNVPPVEDLTDNEEGLMLIVRDILRRYELPVRFLRVMRTDSNMDAFKEEFPDAVEAGKEVELTLAMALKDQGDTRDLWQFLQNVNWGTIQGYTPWMKAKASIFPRVIRLGTTRGEARLMKRKSIEFDDTLGENLLLDVVRYVKQIEAQMRLEPDLGTYEDLWEQASNKFVHSRRLENKLKLWSKELQGMPPEGEDTIFQDIINRTWTTAMSAVFLHPRMAWRNIHQHLAFHPDRTELVRLFIQRPPPNVFHKGKIFYRNFVNQLGGLKADFLMTEGRALPGLNSLTKLASRLSLYAQSDNIPRMWSFFASANKAWIATQAYQESKRTGKDVDKWIRKSGAIHLTHTEQNYALQLLAQADERFNLAVPGLEDVSGAELVSFWLGLETADYTHFLYARNMRAAAEMGSTGRILYNLIVFPRGYAQRMILDAVKVKGVFHGETTWAEAADGFKQIMLRITMGVLISHWIWLVTGWRRKSYNPLTILQYQIGGLAVGIAQDLGELAAAVFDYIDLTQAEEMRTRAIGAIPTLLDRGGMTLVAFYRNLMDSISATLGIEQVGIDTAIRKLRAIIDENYEAPEIDKVDRTLWERFRLAFLAGEVEDPTKTQRALDEVDDEEKRLGEIDAVGRRYTTREFGNTIESAMRQTSDDIWTEEYGRSPRQMFYAECSDSWKELFELPSQPASLRNNWRISHIEEEATLLFWGKFSKSVFTQFSPEGKQVDELLQTWQREYKIEDRMKPKANWSEE